MKNFLKHFSILLTAAMVIGLMALPLSHAQISGGGGGSSGGTVPDGGANTVYGSLNGGGNIFIPVPPCPGSGTALSWTSGVGFSCQTVSRGIVGVQTFTASGTYTPDPGTQSIVILVQAGGGGTGSCPPQTGATNQVCYPGAGAGGSFASAVVQTPVATAITIGAGGQGAPAGATAAPGTAGGTTTFGTLISCPGGTGGGIGSAVGVAPPPCAFTAGTLPVTQIPGYTGYPLSNPNGATAGSAVTTGAGGQSNFGQGAPGVAGITYGNDQTAGNSATNPGSGASGPWSSSAAGGSGLPAIGGGNGATGQVVIQEYN